MSNAAAGARLTDDLLRIANASKRVDGSDIPLGEQCRDAAFEIIKLRALLAEISADAKWQNAPHELLARCRSALAQGASS